MKLLITKATVEGVLQVAVGRKESEFNNFIREAQLFNLKPKFPDAFWSELIKETPDPKYTALLTEGTYVYNGYTYTRPGIDQILSYLTYSLYVLKNQFVDTTFGLVVKTNPQSEPMEYRERRDWSVKYAQMADQLFDVVRLFIERNQTEYSLWFEGCNATKRRYSSHVINKDNYVNTENNLRNRCL